MIDEDHAAQDTPVIDVWRPLAPWKVEPQSQHLCVGEPVEITRHALQDIGGREP